jgi:hypothetical protein
MIGPGDIDGDGWSDVVTGPEGDVSRMRMRFSYGTGRWRTPFPATEPPYGDVNGMDPLL